MANRKPTDRAWDLLQQMEQAYIIGNYAQASACADMARTYQSFPTGTDDDLLTVWFSHTANADPLKIDFEAQTVTGASAPTEGEVSWNFGDGTTTAITNRVLASNVVTLTFGGNHGYRTGDRVLVALTTPDAVFDGLQTVVDVTDTTITYAKTNANVPTAAATGTCKPVGLTHTRKFAANGNYFVTVTVDTAALAARSYGRYVKVPYSIS